ncbi:MAG: phosphonate ABC transporter, permease protein PhnE [Euryarchaeota archaeon]|jgi:phosphonate transport system permease protein|nr:phosphonate ABC transporter, permease protein PhnE [Euryarchaeota archaeon]
MKYRLFGIILFLLFIAWRTLDGLVEGDWGRLEGGLSNLVVFFEESMWPPNWSVLEARSYPVCEEEVGFFCSVGYLGMMETLKIAFVSTVLGFIGAISLSSLAARNLTPLFVSIPVRVFLSAVRSLPSLIWAILFVIVIGFGPLSGVLAMTFYTVGYLGKLQYEVFEGMGNDPLEAGRAMGLSRPSIFFNIVIPENGNHLLSQLMFMFEYNVRHGTVIGIVGAGGIGYYISTYLKFLQYDKVFALLILIFIVVVLIDLLSLMVRSFVNEEGDVRKPTWLTLLMKARKRKQTSVEEA